MRGDDDRGDHGLVAPRIQATEKLLPGERQERDREAGFMGDSLHQFGLKARQGRLRGAAIGRFHGNDNIAGGRVMQGEPEQEQAHNRNHNRDTT